MSENAGGLGFSERNCHPRLEIEGEREPHVLGCIYTEKNFHHSRLEGEGGEEQVISQMLVSLFLLRFSQFS